MLHAFLSKSLERLVHALSLLCLALALVASPALAAPGASNAPVLPASQPPAAQPGRPEHLLAAAPHLLADSRLGAVAQTRLVASDPDVLDQFGWSVAISGDTAVIGARSHDADLGGGPLANAGAAYVFVRSGNTWYQEAKLMARDAKPGDGFGISVAIDGDTIIVGANGADLVKARDGVDAADAGAAYIFTRQGIEWSQKAKLIARDAAKEDNFGVSVAIDGITAVVGADSKDVFGFLVEAGTAYVFLLRGNSWDQKAQLFASDPGVGDYFGCAVDISGERIIVGANEANFTGTRGPGAAYIYNGRGNNWLLEARLSAEDDRRGDFFGNAVAISSETAVVGAPFKDPRQEPRGLVTNGGAAYVFSLRGSTWKETALLTAEKPLAFAEFGSSVAVSGDTIVVGARNEDWGGYSGNGAAYVFTPGAAPWELQTRITADFAYDDDAFGVALALSGDRLIVGASGRDPLLITSAGEAFVYRLGQIVLPDTGFAPGLQTPLALQPPAKAYASLGDLWLEIPALRVKTPLVGVHQGNDGWDVSWLWEQAGYLEGTAFPTWAGNSGIAGHAFLPNGKPGPFNQLGLLKYGDRVIVHAWGQRYIYEVRQVKQVSPKRLDVLQHEELPWLTLITCDDFDSAVGGFRQRLVVRAVQVAIVDE
jgi:LPXTG-site transpeptidase (sortase) family protein